ncbi:MAG: PH domain-containing protein [Elusimicrobiales bacterium]|nr:PH domain-containing protein [Elusimicrobiales bacterium]
MTPLSIPIVVLGAVLTLAPLDTPGTVIISLVMGLFLLIAFLLAIWIPAFYRSLEYSIDEDAVRCNSGVFWKRRVTVPYSKITNVDIMQGPVQRMYGVGSVHVQTAGAGGAQGGMAELAFLGVRNLEGVREAIMTRVKFRAAAAPGPAEPERAPAGDTQERMLAELKAIRAAIEKKG